MKYKSTVLGFLTLVTLFLSTTPASALQDPQNGDTVCYLDAEIFKPNGYSPVPVETYIVVESEFYDTFGNCSGLRVEWRSGTDEGLPTYKSWTLQRRTACGYTRLSICDEAKALTAEDANDSSCMQEIASGWTVHSKCRLDDYFQEIDPPN